MKRSRLGWALALACVFVVPALAQTTTGTFTVQRFNDFLQSLAAPSSTLGASDKVPILQNGQTKGWAPANYFLNRNANNVSDAAAARTNLGLGSAALHPSTDFSPRLPAGAKSAVLFGDSYFGNGDANNPASVPCTTNCQALTSGIGNWIDWYTKSRVNRVPNTNNFGVPGDTTTQMLARINTVLAVDPDIVFMDGGINDIVQSLPASTIIANLRAIYEIFLSHGITVIRISVPPLTDAWTYNATMTAYAQAVNEADRRYAETAGKRGFYFVDLDSIFADPAATTWAPRSGMFTTGGLHPNPEGYSLIAFGAAQIVNQIAPGWRLPMLSSSNVYNASLNPGGNVLTNGKLTGTAGTLAAGSNCTGTVADSWNLSAANGGGATCIGSLITLPDSSTAQQLVFSGTYTGGAGIANGGAIWQTLSSPASLFSPGDVVEAAMDVTWSGCVNIANVTVLWQTTESGVVYNYQSGGSGGFTYPIPARPAMPGFLKIRTPRRTVGASPSAATLWLNINFIDHGSTPSPVACTVKVASVSVNKVQP